jgi:hypothetical protein
MLEIINPVVSKTDMPEVLKVLEYPYVIWEKQFMKEKRTLKFPAIIKKRAGIYFLITGNNSKNRKTIRE